MFAKDFASYLPDRSFFLRTALPTTGFLFSKILK